MQYKLFLDDVRKPWDCIGYMRPRIGSRLPIYLETGWVVCKNYGCFRATIDDMGLPTFVSFDHDLSVEHYIDGDQGVWSDSYEEQSGYNCAQYLIHYCVKNGLNIPDFTVHSMNPVGTERIFSLLNQAKSKINDREGIQVTGNGLLLQPKGFSGGQEEVL